MCFHRKRSDFRDFFPFSTLGAPFQGCALKILSRFQAENGPQTLERLIFPVLGAVLGETPTDQIGSHAECGPTESHVGSHLPLGARDMGV